ncbi:MAG TPA: tripartite tricarboxylate transporter substrate-binding protein, partial [Bordetella sp.]|nr:tripartite tricarboxylate transporter substrate-binding protein [Bordetella sp.]
MLKSKLARRWIAALMWSMAAAGAMAASGQDADGYPTRSIHLVLGQSPGGAPDILARIMADSVGRALGQPVVVEFKPSAGGIIAQDSVAKAPADGYTWLFATPTMLAVTPYMGRDLPFDPFKDFIPIAMLGQTANVLVTGPATSARNPAELIQQAKQSAGRVQFASAGLGTTSHLAGELLASMTQTEMLHVPYKGAGQALNDVVAGLVDFMITSPAAAKSFINSGRLKVMATTGSRPDPMLPDLPLLS